MFPAFGSLVSAAILVSVSDIELHLRPRETCRQADSCNTAYSSSAT